jgi:hypothetical protein
MAILSRILCPGVALLTSLLALPGQDGAGGRPKRNGPPNDPAARAFLREAEERAVSWNGFPGFTAEMAVYHAGKTHKGKVTVEGARKVRVDLADGEARKWAAGVIHSIAAASQRKDFEERYAGVGVVFGKDDLHPLGQLVELKGDPYQSRYRILDREIRVIERSTPEYNMMLSIIAIERDTADRKHARSFVVYYFDKKTGELLRSEAIHDRRLILNGYALPETWKETRVGKGGERTYSLSLRGHRLLPEAPVESARELKQ